MTGFKRRRYRRRICLVIIFICFGIAFSFICYDIKPIVLEVAINDAQAVNERVINKAVLDTLEKDKVDFNTLINITYNEDNSVKSVNTDSIELGKIKLNIIKRIVEGFNKKGDVDSVSIRLGTLIDNEFFYGRGPEIKFNYEMSNTIDCSYISKFVSTGINQSKHTFSLRFTTEVCLITRLFSTSTVFETDVLLNEMVIVGEIPENYTDITLN